LTAGPATIPGEAGTADVPGIGISFRKIYRRCAKQPPKSQMKTSTQVYRELKAAQFSEPQTTALVDILQAAGVVEPEPPESELERIEQYLLAEPFQPFVIAMSGGKTYRIDRRDQCGFTRHGSVRLSGLDDGKWAILSTDHIIRVQKI
jgi:hypothetical protein